MVEIGQGRKEIARYIESDTSITEIVQLFNGEIEKSQSSYFFVKTCFWEFAMDGYP